MPPSTASSSCGCGPISPRSTTSGGARPRGRASWRSSAASSASWHARSSAISAAPPEPPSPSKWLLHLYSSINAPSEGGCATLKGELVEEREHEYPTPDEALANVFQ